ncbi:hypothetical protein XENOCAPTIV_005232 [Xenoophorus captivus]|uniref:Uncharacterized protein n=1 Tax=Xenoophorus captivus TaxID=1517983 RepID=A0ABV0SF48_9TELE
MSLNGDALSVIENPVAVSHPFNSESTAGVAATKGVQGWLKGTRSTTHAHRLVRLLAAVCAVGLLGGLLVGVWFLVKLLLRPSSSQTTVGLGDTKETSFCNVTDDVSISDPRKGLCLSHFLRACLSLLHGLTVKPRSCCCTTYCYLIHYAASRVTSDIIFYINRS